MKILTVSYQWDCERDKPLIRYSSKVSKENGFVSGYNEDLNSAVNQIRLFQKAGYKIKVSEESLDSDERLIKQKSELLGLIE